MSKVPDTLDAVDRRIITATQGGLPLVPQPFEVIAAEVGVPAAEIVARMERMLATGIIRRVGAVPNHYALGTTANGMSVWNVDDERISDLGPRIGALEFVSHCYRRPRRLPLWPYNLFAMVHGGDRNEVAAKVAVIAEVLGATARAHEILYSTRILKKTGLRIAA